MRRLTAVTVLAVAALALAGCGGSDEGTETTATETTATTETTTTETGAETTALFGSVGPGFEISLDETEVAAGTYSLAMDDKASNHNFHFTGPGVDVSTDVAGTGLKTEIVELQPGTYTFVCDPHSSSMNGTITVG